MVLPTNASDVRGCEPSPPCFLHSCKHQFTIDLCGACTEKVTWSHSSAYSAKTATTRGIKQNIGDTGYARLGDHFSVVWLWYMCDGSNYSYLLIDLYGIETKNRFSNLEDSILTLPTSRYKTSHPLSNPGLNAPSVEDLLESWTSIVNPWWTRQKPSNY